MTEDTGLFSTTYLNESLSVTVLECPCDISENSSASVLTSVRGPCSHSFFILLAQMQSVCAGVTADCQLPASWSCEACDPFPLCASPGQNGRSCSESWCVKTFSTWIFIRFLPWMCVLLPFFWDTFPQSVLIGTCKEVIMLFVKGTYTHAQTSIHAHSHAHTYALFLSLTPPTRTCACMRTHTHHTDPPFK